MDSLSSSVKTNFGFMDLPAEIQCLVFKSLEKQQLCTLRAVCTSLRDLIDVTFCLPNVFLADSVDFSHEFQSKTLCKIDHLFMQNYTGPLLVSIPGYWRQSQKPVSRGLRHGLRCKSLAIGIKNSKDNVKSVLLNFAGSTSCLNLHCLSLAEFDPSELRGLDLSKVFEFEFDIRYSDDIIEMMEQGWEKLQRHIRAVIEILNSAKFGTITAFKVEVSPSFEANDDENTDEVARLTGYVLHAWNGELWTAIKSFITRHAATITEVGWVENTDTTAVDPFKQLRLKKLGIALDHSVRQNQKTIGNIINLQLNTLEYLNVQNMCEVADFDDYPDEREATNLKSLELNLDYRISSRSCRRGRHCMTAGPRYRRPGCMTKTLADQVNQGQGGFLLDSTTFRQVEHLKIQLNLCEDDNLGFLASALSWQTEFQEFLEGFQFHVKVLEIVSFLNFIYTPNDMDDILREFEYLEQIRITIVDDPEAFSPQLEDCLECFKNLEKIVEWGNQQPGLKANLETNMKLRRYPHGSVQMSHFVLEVQVVDRYEFTRKTPDS